MTFRARLLLAIFIFACLPCFYIFRAGNFDEPFIAYAVFGLCFFVLMGALAGAVKIDRIVEASENRAIQSEIELQAFLERIHDGVFLVDATGKILEINTAMAHLLGHDPDFLKGKNIWDHLKSNKGKPDESFFPKGHLRTTCRMTGKRKSGDTTDLLVDLYLVKKEGVFHGLRGCAGKAEKILEEASFKEDLAVAIFRTLSKKLKDFTQQITGIMASAGQEPPQTKTEVTVQGGSAPEPRSGGGPVQQDGGTVGTGSQGCGGQGLTPLERLQTELKNSANQLITSLADSFEQDTITGWKPRLRLNLVDPDLLLEAAAKRFESTAKLRGQTLSILKPQAASQANVNGDSRYLLELLCILLDNAVKYTPNNGKITLCFFNVKDGYGFTVDDTGIGIPQHEIPLLFTPFFRGDNSINKTIEGLGLGLWTAKQIAEAHGGSIFAQSQFGQNAMFKVEFPKHSLPKDIKWMD
ncbi:MAG: PAS domain-containing protein [Elusimicrobia bacterium]|nr:PAS domain-containing protein [Elusimicrobiota bacterium]